MREPPQSFADDIVTANPFVTGSVVLSILLALVYFWALQLTLLLVSPYQKASLGKRLCAAGIDGLLVGSFVVAPWNAGSLPYTIAAALYLLLRDAFGGQSIGKLFMGLVVVHVDTGQRCKLAGSLKRNAVLALPGASLIAILLEARTLVRDRQGQRLGDRLAHTQVVEGLGARDLVKDLQEWWAGFLAELPDSAKPDRRRPVRVPHRRNGQDRPRRPQAPPADVVPIRAAARSSINAPRTSRRVEEHA